MNMGAYFHVAQRIKTCMSEENRPIPMQLQYAGRPPCASTATGFGKVGGPLVKLFFSVSIARVLTEACVKDWQLQRDRLRLLLSAFLCMHMKFSFSLC